MVGSHWRGAKEWGAVQLFGFFVCNLLQERLFSTGPLSALPTQKTTMARSDCLETTAKFIPFCFYGLGGE